MLLNLSRINNTKRRNNIRPIYVRYDLSENSFFPCTISAWNKLNSNISISVTLSIFKNNFLNIIRLSPNSIFDIHNACGFKLLTRLRLVLYEHNFRHCFQDNFVCGKDIMAITLFFLHCTNFHIPRQALFQNIRRFYLKVRCR